MKARPVAKIGRMASTIGGTGFPHALQGRASGEVPFIKVSDLSSPINSKGVTGAQNWVSKNDIVELGARIAPPGSIVFPKVGAALLKNVRRTLHCSAALDNNLMGIVPREGVSQYWMYALSTIDLGQLSASGPLPFVTESQVKSLKIPFPSTDEQHHIANFLDAETGRIDDLLDARNNQLRLLDFKESAILDQFTRAAGGPRIRVKYLSSRITSGPRGWGELAATSGSAFLRITNIPRRGIELLRHDMLYVAAPVGPERERTRTRIGDVLVSITADIGSVGLVGLEDVDANVSQHIALVRPLPEICDPRWLAYSIKAPAARDLLQIASYGGTKVGLGLGEIANLEIAVPALDVQYRQAGGISEELAKLSSLRERLNQQVALLKERRQALITAVVTGEINASIALRVIES